MPVMSGSLKGNGMTTNSSNARIFGSDSDSISLAPIGTTLPTTIDGALDGAFEDVGWLHTDGIKESPTGSKAESRGFQGMGIIRTRIETPGTTIGFHALESKGQTKSLRYDEKSTSTSGGVRKTTRGPGQKVSSRSAVVDIYDADDVTVKERWVIPKLDISPDGDREFTNSDIAGFPFLGDIIGDYDTFASTASSAIGTGWDLTISGIPTGGTFTLTVNGVATAGITYNASTAAIASALNALSGVTGLTGITVTSSAPFVLTFPSNVTLSANGSALTGGTTPDAVAVLS